MRDLEWKHKVYSYLETTAEVLHGQTHTLAKTVISNVVLTCIWNLMSNCENPVDTCDFDHSVVCDFTQERAIVCMNSQWLWSHAQEPHSLGHTGT